MRFGVDCLIVGLLCFGWVFCNGCCFWFLFRVGLGCLFVVWLFALFALFVGGSIDCLLFWWLFFCVDGFCSLCVGCCVPFYFLVITRLFGLVADLVALC